ncbi:hypothetical protein SCHPADRAFT_994296 [Schizopora paradoxa]|uniref:Uncharacterized protein n=1 Tax=Schizopora paradoxa TaxID=27342 RepID=A0A0H2S744_9AGAM|nr:hypothetical protein SCHPADRAFT_994296 [Schizopora paradoxa]
MAQNLPEDLLYAIFLRAPPSEFVLTRNAASWSETRMIPPLSFSLVCRSWRALVLSHPKLWSEIRIISETFPNNRDPIIPGVLEKWLSLSSSAPLGIYLDVRGKGHHYVSKFSLPLFIQESHRWKSASIRVYCWPGSGTNSIIPTIQCLSPLSSLSLDLRHLTSSPEIRIDLSHSVSGNSSPLEYLHVGPGVVMRLPHCRDDLRLPHLRSFHFNGMRQDQILEDLRSIIFASPNLEHLTLKAERWPTTLTPNRDPVHLPRLTSFTLTTTDRFTVDYFLDILTCPSLSTLICELDYSDDTKLEEYTFLDIRHVHDFLARSRSFRQLHTLRLRVIDMSSEFTPDCILALKDLLLSLQNLKILELRASTIPRAVFEMLTVTGEILLDDPHSRPCPFLSDIQLFYESDHYVYDFTSETVEEMIISRWKAGDLRGVYLTFPSSRAIGIEERKRIVECIAEGLIFI